MSGDFDPRETICALCRQFYDQGWVSGTGGGISLRVDGRVYMAPSGVQKERLKPADLFVLDEDGEVLERPADPKLKLSQCSPLFFSASPQWNKQRLRDTVYLGRCFFRKHGQWLVPD